MLRIFIVLLLAISSAQAAHITDKLLVGLYSKPDASAQPTKVLPSGTPLEVLEQKDGFSRVRLGDGNEGWVKSVYISKEKPARAMLLELQAKSSKLQKQLQKAERDLKAAQSTAAPEMAGNLDKLNKELAQTQKRLTLVSSALKNEQQETKRLNAALKKSGSSGSDNQSKQIQTLKKKLSASEDELKATLHEARLLQDLLKKTGQTASQRIAALEQELLQTKKKLESEDGASVSASSALVKQNAIIKQRLKEVEKILSEPLPEVEIESDSGFGFGFWALIIILLLVGGFVGGIAYKNHNIRRRYGGFRI